MSRLAVFKRHKIARTRNLYKLLTMLGKVWNGDGYGMKHPPSKKA